MKNKDIPEFALSVLRKHNIDASPLDILRLARDEGIKVIKDSDVCVLKPTELGRLMWFVDESVIIYDDTRTRQQKKFTVAHELGHYFLQHNKEYDRFMRYQEEQRVKHGRHIEKQADIFAKALLNGGTTNGNTR